MYLEIYKDSIGDLCERHHVNSLYAFGSVLTDRFNDKSDVDMIVSFKKMPLEDYTDNYYDLKFTLQEILQRPIDLLEEQAIKNPYFIQNVNQNKHLIYG